MKEIIKIESLTKDFGSGRGIFDINLNVLEGECFGFLGPNGAGKSTTIRILMGFIRPDKGLTKINGLDTTREREIIMQNVSYIPGEVALPLNLKGSEVISIQKELKHVKDDTLLNYLIKYFELDTSLLCKEMSLGMKRKMAIVIAFMSDPDIIILDEPSSGLDPEMQDKFIELIKQEKQRGKTIFLSSHIFREIDVSCDRIAIIKDGKIVSFFNAYELKHKSLKTYEISFKNAMNLKLFVEDSNEDFKIIENDNLKLVVTCDDKNINKFVDYIRHYEITDFKERKETLEDYFMSFYKEDREYSGL